MENLEGERNNVPVDNVIDLETASCGSASDDEEGRDRMVGVKSEEDVIILDLDEYDDSYFEIVAPPETTSRITYPTVECKEEDAQTLRLKGDGQTAISETSSPTAAAASGAATIDEPSTLKRSRIRKNGKRSWTAKEVKTLMGMVEKNPNDWNNISKILHRTVSACKQRHMLEVRKLREDRERGSPRKSSRRRTASKIKDNGHSSPVDRRKSRTKGRQRTQRRLLRVHYTGGLLDGKKRLIPVYQDTIFSDLIDKLRLLPSRSTSNRNFVFEYQKEKDGNLLVCMSEEEWVSIALPRIFANADRMDMDDVECSVTFYDDNGEQV